MSHGTRPSILRWLLVGVPCYASWLIANIISLLLYPILLPVELLGGRGGKRFLRGLCVNFFRLFFLFHLPLIGMYRVLRSNDFDKLKSVGSGLVVANHTSWLDPLMVLILIPNVRILVSSKYGRIPVASRAMEWLDCIFVDRRSRASVLLAAEKMQSALAQDYPVAVFPEGKRGTIGQLRPFQDIIFRIAAQKGYPVLPLLLIFDQPFLGPKAENFLTVSRAILKIQVLEKMAPEKDEKAQDLAFRVRRTMKKALKKAVEEMNE